MTEETKEHLGRSLWFGAYFGIVSTILRLIFTDVFALSKAVALALAILLTSLGAYPLSDRGSKIRRRLWFIKGERWRIWDTMALSVILSLAAYAVARLFEW